MAVLDGAAGIPMNLTSLVISDGTGTPLTITASLVSATIAFTLGTPGKTEIRHQGKHVSGGAVVNQTDDGNCQITLSAVVKSMLGSSNTHLYEALSQTGKAASIPWLTTAPAGNAYGLKWVATYTDGGGTEQIATFAAVFADSISQSWDGGEEGGMMQIDFTGTAFQNAPAIT